MNHEHPFVSSGCRNSHGVQIFLESTVNPINLSLCCPPFRSYSRKKTPLFFFILSLSRLRLILISSMSYTTIRSTNLYQFKSLSSDIYLDFLYLFATISLLNIYIDRRNTCSKDIRSCFQIGWRTTLNF